MVAAAASTGAVDSAQLQQLKMLFQEMDLDGDGIISGQQLAAGLAQLGTTLSDKDVAEFLQVSRVSGIVETVQSKRRVLSSRP
jgi:Ca2+-binding EF-hand superfamily protein